MENTVAHAFISEPNLTLHPSIYRRFGHSMPHIASVQVFFLIFTGRPLTFGIDLIELCSTFSLFRPRTSSLQPWKRPISRAMGGFAPIPQSYGGILRPPLGFWILPIPWDFAHTTQVLPSQLCPQSYALRAMPSELCPQSYALRAMSSELCPQSYALRAMPSELCPQSYALRAMP